MKKSMCLQSSFINKLREILYFLLAIIAAFLVIRGFKWLIAEDHSNIQPPQPQTLQWLHELESSDSISLTEKDGTSVVLADDVPVRERLEFKIKNKFVFSFTRELDMRITNNTNDAIFMGMTLDGLEVLENNKWIYFPPSGSYALDAIAIIKVRSESETTIAYPIYHYDLKKGHYRAIISYRHSGQLIITPVEFDVTGIF